MNELPELPKLPSLPPVGGGARRRRIPRVPMHSPDAENEPRRGTRKAEEDKFLSKREIAALLYAAHLMDQDRPKDRVFFQLFLQFILGLRIGEVCQLRWTDLSAKYVDDKGLTRAIRCPTLKKRGDTIPRYDVPVLAHFDEVRAAFDPRHPSANAQSPWLFPSAHNPANPRVTRTADRLFHAARDRAGIPSVITSHALRHSAATFIAGAVRNRVVGGSDLEWARRFTRQHLAERGSGGGAILTYVHTSIADWKPFIKAGTMRLPPLAPL